MRKLIKSRQDKRSGWTRRVCWYQTTVTPLDNRIDIRLEFTDCTGVFHKFYTVRDEAQRDYDAFDQGRLTVLELQTSIAPRNV